MKCLAPSILSADFGNLEEQLRLIDEAGAQYVHFDVMDGMFVPCISYGEPVLRSIRKYSKRMFDVHMMIQAPERYVADFVEAGADIITVHVEACDNLEQTIETIKSFGVKVGVALSPDTPVSAVLDVLDKVDMVLVMTVYPGFGGQKLIPSTLDKVKELADIIRECELSIDIEVDGGINDDTIDDALNAGANIIVAGSAVFNGDVQANVTRFLGRM